MVFASLLIVFSASATAVLAGKVYEVDYIHVEITVLDDGSFMVIEDLSFNLISGSFSRGWRSIPFTGIDDIDVLSVESLTNIELSEWNVEYGVDRVNIYWSYPIVVAPARVIFRVKYRVYGALLAPSKLQNVIDWLAVGYEWSVPIREVLVVVRLPGDFSSSELLSYSPEPIEVQSVDGETIIKFRYVNLPPHTAYRIIVAFPKIYEPPLKLYFFFKEYPIESGLLIALFSTIAMVGLWLFKGRHPRISVDTSIISIGIKPSKLSALEAAYLVNGSIGLSQIISGLVDLARRGYLRIEYDDNAMRFELTEDGLRALHGSGRLKSFERELLHLAAMARSSRLLPMFPSEIAKIRRLVEEELTRNGYFKSIPSDFKFKIAKIAIAIFAIPFIILVLGYMLAPIARSLAIFVRLFKGLLIGSSISAVPVGLIGLIFFSNYTEKGYREAILWRSYVNRVMELNERELKALSDREKLFEECLPVVLAFRPFEFYWWATMWSPFMPYYWPYWFIYRHRGAEDVTIAPVPSRGLVDFQGFIESFNSAIRIAFEGLPSTTRVFGGGPIGAGGGFGGGGGGVGGAGGGGGGVG